METYYGHVRTPADAIILFEACRMGLLPRVQRRLSEKERQSIRSGSVFVWDEREAGMRRWTDGKSWSASRVSGSFLTYREMEGKRGGSVSQASVPRVGKSPESGRGSDDDREDEGPDGYRYKPDGLMKQSFSITTSAGQHLHLISYYARAHPSAVNLQQPTTDPALRHVRPQKGLYPESTVNDQQNLPVVTRATPPTVPVGYGAAYLPPVASNGPPPPYGPPHHSMPHHQPPHPHQHPHPHAHSLPPPPHAGPYERQPFPEAVPPGSSNGAPPPYPGRSPRMMQDPHHEQRSPRVYPLAADHRLASPRISASNSQTNGAIRSPHILKQTPPMALQQLGSMGTPPKPENASFNVPGIGALINGASLAPIAPPSSINADSPGARNGSVGEGPRDINLKLGFAEDVSARALRQLDRAFVA
ncbi:hypothetical protein N7495_008534 [Penicillium taxi]|uniref:uncharacterized protein n=1 Tax=Penicillium taxi TaxID=168475 RepID=UPI0025452BF3|nr:uncharacterized protein N7495_008534 [Penicillium taxi]KAJ5888493.1 hypothetical protein N7495_008534 [Penicillium taxi]